MAATAAESPQRRECWLPARAPAPPAAPAPESYRRATTVRGMAPNATSASTGRRGRRRGWRSRTRTTRSAGDCPARCAPRATRTAEVAAAPPTPTPPARGRCAQRGLPPAGRKAGRGQAQRRPLRLRRSRRREVSKSAATLRLKRNSDLGVAARLRVEHGDCKGLVLGRCCSWTSSKVQAHCCYLRLPPAMPSKAERFFLVR